MSKIFQCSAQGDVIYFAADSQADAENQLRKAMGPIPENLLSWREVDALPDGEEFM